MPRVAQRHLLAVVVPAVCMACGVRETPSPPVLVSVAPASSAPPAAPPAAPGREVGEAWSARALAVLRATASCRSIDYAHPAPTRCDDGASHWTCGKNIHTFELSECRHTDDGDEAARLLTALTTEVDDFCVFQDYVVLSFSSERGADLFIYGAGCTVVFQW